MFEEPIEMEGDQTLGRRERLSPRGRQVRLAHYHVADGCVTGRDGRGCGLLTRRMRSVRTDSGQEDLDRQCGYGAVDRIPAGWRDAVVGWGRLLDSDLEPDGAQVKIPTSTRSVARSDSLPLAPTTEFWRRRARRRRYFFTISWTTNLGHSTATLLRRPEPTAWRSHRTVRALAVGQEDGGISLWDAQSRQRRLTLAAHEGFVAAMAFAPDGSTLASSGGDRTTRTWDLPAGRSVRDQEPSRHARRTGVFSNGRLLFLSDQTRPVVWIWDVTTGVERVLLSADSRERSSRWRPVPMAQPSPPPTIEEW